jgi:hypothetical protein
VAEAPRCTLTRYGHFHWLDAKGMPKIERAYDSVRIDRAVSSTVVETPVVPVSVSG